MPRHAHPLTRRRLGGAAFAVAVLGAPLAQAAAAPHGADSPDHVFVALDKAKLIKLPAHVETVIVGNPSIADVTMLKRTGLMVVTGKGFGETNVIFVDPSGQALSEATITVRTGETLLTVQRGMERESYSCAPRCEPAVALGDATKFMTDATGRITSRNALVVSGQPQH